VDGCVGVGVWVWVGGGRVSLQYPLPTVVAV
jgi:hypothetical protein